MVSRRIDLIIRDFSPDQKVIQCGLLIYQLLHILIDLADRKNTLLQILTSTEKQAEHFCPA